MALTNSQYNELMRRYSRIRFQHQHEMEERLRHIYAQCPRLLEISKLLPTSSAALAKAKITGNKAQALNAHLDASAVRFFLLFTIHLMIFSQSIAARTVKILDILTETANVTALSRLA